MIISTDLDGTLLDHHTYSWAAAEPAIRKAQAKKYSIIMNTSKTAQEVHALQKAMCINAPFIVENGSAIYIPHQLEDNVPNEEFNPEDYEIYVLGDLRHEIVEQVQNLRQTFNFKFEGYSDWSIETLIKYTQLTSRAAHYSLARCYSEPILWFDDDIRFNLFQEKIEGLGYKILRGGRFIHVLGQTDKGRAIKSLTSRLEKHSALLVALGDSHNDIDMLKVADVPILVRSPVSEFPIFDSEKKITYTEDFGPSGWNKAVLSLIES